VLLVGHLRQERDRRSIHRGDERLRALGHRARAAGADFVPALPDETADAGADRRIGHKTLLGPVDGKFGKAQGNSFGTRGFKLTGRSVLVNKTRSCARPPTAPNFRASSSIRRDGIAGCGAGGPRGYFS